MKHQQESKLPLVLIADDDDQLRLLVRKALERSHFRTCEAEDGAQALKLFEAHRPDIVILDIVMPVMDGLTACSVLRMSAGGRRRITSYNVCYTKLLRSIFKKQLI